MSAREAPGFAYVRKAEAEALMALRPSAAKVWIAIRSRENENKPFACGSRDFEDWGIGRDAAAYALAALVKVGLLSIVKQGARSGRGHRTVFSIIHTKAYSKEKAGKPANYIPEKAGKPDIKGRKTRQLPSKKAGFPDTPKDTSSTSSQKSKEEEVSIIERKAERQRLDDDRKRLRDRMLRIDAAAKALSMLDCAFIQKAGGPEPADFLAKRFASGGLTKQQLRSRLDAPSQGLAEETKLEPSPETKAVCGVG